LILNRWIISETAAAADEVTRALEQLRFNEAANIAYQFVWSRYCDWYLELIKPILTAGTETARAETRATAAWARDQLFKLLHPFMPFITEELWDRTAERSSLLIIADWPQAALSRNEEACAEIEWLITLVSGVRSVRTEMNVPAGAKIELVLVDASAASHARLERNLDSISTLARLSSVSFAETVPTASAQFVLGEAVVALPLGGVIDVTKERARLQKELQRAESEIAKVDAKLGNADFISRAPEDVIDEQKERRAESEALATRLREAVGRLG